MQKQDLNSIIAKYRKLAGSSCMMKNYIGTSVSSTTLKIISNSLKKMSITKRKKIC